MTIRDRKAYLVGGGIGSLAAAAFMIRDGGLPGGNITIYEALPVLGGSLDGGGDHQDGYTLRGGRMLTTDNFECTWGLFKSIPSLVTPGKTVFDETVEFNQEIKSHSRARLVDRNRAIVDVTSMGFSMTDRMELLKLMTASEVELGTAPISDWLSPEFFTTTFWHMWATTFAFQPWHSALEFKRYLHRFIKEILAHRNACGSQAHGLQSIRLAGSTASGVAFGKGRSFPKRLFCYRLRSRFRGRQGCRPGDQIQARRQERDRSRCGGRRRPGFLPERLHDRRIELRFNDAGSRPADKAG